MLKLLLIISAFINIPFNEKVKVERPQIEIKEGIYSCVGHTTTGKKYKTLVLVTKNDEYYDIEWRGGYSGLGYLHNNQLVVSWTNEKNVGLSIYDLSFNKDDKLVLSGFQIVEYKKTKETWTFLAEIPNDPD